jgi:hypothetical protein
MNCLGTERITCDLRFHLSFVPVTGSSVHMMYMVLITSNDIFICCQQISLGTITVQGTENKVISGYIFGRGSGVFLHMVMIVITKSRIC